MSPASATLKPGTSQKFTVKQKLAAHPGDVSAALEFDTAFHRATTVPVTKRTLISTNNDGGVFTGVLTGGNGRAGTPSQTESYYFDVPKGKKNLAMDLTFTGTHEVSAFLESPEHQIVSLSSDVVADAQGKGSMVPSATGYVNGPTAGRWVLVVDDMKPAIRPGDLADTFTGKLSYNLVDVKVTGLPEGKVTAGAPVTATVTVNAAQFTAGVWGQDPTPVGPTNGSVSGKATEAMSVTAQAFDRSAVASTGDLWLGGVDLSAPGLKAVTIEPGRTGTLTVTFTPTGKSGDKVSGVVYVDTYDPVYGTADELSGIPYGYTVSSWFVFKKPSRRRVHTMRPWRRRRCSRRKSARR